MNRILVAIDNSEITHLVLDRAIELAHATDSKLRLMCVVPPTIDPPVANMFVTTPCQDINVLVAHAQSELGAYEVRIPAKYRDGVLVVVGQPAEAICKTAKSYDASFVVIGAHRYGLLDRMLGTTAAKIVNHIDRPVLIVRPVATTTTKTTTVGEKNGVAEHNQKKKGSFLADHPMLDAATLAGAVSGAAVGALAGPPGAIAGGIIGTAIGALAGTTMDREDRRAEIRDHELDDAIGVTKGDLGARDRAVAAFMGMRHAQRDEERDAAAARMTSLAKMLRAEHQRLERVYEKFLGAYRSGSWEIVRQEWAQFEPALRKHMDVEERAIFPAFRVAAPAEADALAAEHAHVRKLLDTLGIAVELHAMPQGDAEELVMRMREHGQREERMLYPWLEEQPHAHTCDALGKLTAA